MICLIGLGSNLDSPKKNLERAAAALKNISPSTFKMSPVYQTAAILPDKAPIEWDLPYFNAVVEIDWAYEVDELLVFLKNLEKSLGRAEASKWAPRIIDLDVLTFGNSICETPNIQVPHSRILERSFVLDPIKDIRPSFILPGTSKTILAHARQLKTHRPLIMGVVNVTPDSFSDGGKLNDAAGVADLIKTMDQYGTSIIDIGAESTRPGARLLNSEEEWQRLEKPLRFINSYFSDRLIKPLISVDTYKFDIAQKGLELGWIDIVNDVSGFEDSRMLSVIAESNCQYILMHNLGVPANPKVTLMPGCDPVEEIKDWLDAKLSKIVGAGISLDRVIFDVGIGFGKTAEQSLQLLERMHEFANLPVRLLVGHSRKSFMKQIQCEVQTAAEPEFQNAQDLISELTMTKDSPKARDAITLAFSYRLAKQGVDILRVHDFQTHTEAFV